MNVLDWFLIALAVAAGTASAGLVSRFVRWAVRSALAAMPRPEEETDE